MKIIKTDEVFGIKHSGSDGIAAAEMLKQFCQWQKRNNPDEPSPEHHDAALLLTRFVLEREICIIKIYIFLHDIKFVVENIFLYKTCIKQS